MALRLTCPCGERLFGYDEAGLATRAHEHLAHRHPGREYSDEEIVTMAVTIPDRLVPEG